MKTFLLVGLCLAALLICAVAIEPSGLMHGFNSLAEHAGPMTAMMVAPMSRSTLLGSVAVGRGIQTVRAEGDAATLVKQLIGDLEKSIDKKLEATNKAFEDFKIANNAKKDGLDQASVDKINNSITEYGAEIDKMNQQLAALRLGAGADNVAGGAVRASVTPEEKAYRQAFSGKGGYLRRGADNGLGDLAVKASLSSDSNPDGGYTVVPEIDTAISRVQSAMSAMRGIAQVLTISSDTYRKLVSQGGAASGWVGERESRPTTAAPTLAGIDFPAMELYAMPATTQRLLDDSSVNIEQWLADEVGITFNEQEGAAFVTGDGNNKPKGFLAYDKLADASYAWGSLGYIVTGAATTFATASSSVNPADALLSLVYALKQGYRVNGSWMMNRTVQGSVRQFKDQNGNYIWQPAMANGQPATLFGYPVSDDDNMPNVGANTYPVAFGDFKRGYLIVDRIGVRVLRDNLTSKGNVLFYTTKRVGGGVQNFEAIKLLKCST